MDYAQQVSTSPPISREDILSALQQWLAPLDYVYAMWQGGAAAFARVDAWSDIDLCLDIADDQIEAVVVAVDEALSALSPLSARFRLPEPTWHGHAQVFYQLRDANPFLMVDCVFMRHSHPHKLLQPEQHGQAVVHFDKVGVVQAPPWDEASQQTRRQARLAYWSGFLSWSSVLVEKEIARRRSLDALGYYQSVVIRPLVELLRLRYDPARYEFHLRYLHLVLPPAIAERLARLAYVADLADLSHKHAEARLWMRQLLDELTSA